MVALYASLSLLTLLPTVLGHALITSPPTRQPGDAHLQKCGRKSFDEVKKDVTGHIEDQEPVNGGCELTLCRGLLFEDQPRSNIQTVVPSQQLSLDVNCTIAHGGPANVTLIDTTVGGAGRIIGGFLRSFDDFCPVGKKAPLEQTKLQFNLPDAAAIGNSCGTAGQCVVQLFWATPDLSQNYYYCVDLAVVQASAANAPDSPNTQPAQFSQGTGPSSQFPLAPTTPGQQNGQQQQQGGQRQQQGGQQNQQQQQGNKNNQNVGQNAQNGQNGQNRGQNQQQGIPSPSFPPSNAGNPAGVVNASPPLIVPGRADQLAGAAGSPPTVLGPSGFQVVAGAAPTALVTPISSAAQVTSGARRSRPMFFSQFLFFL